MRKRRHDAQALLTFGCGLAAAAKLGDLAAQRLDLFLQLGQPGPAGIAILAARRAVGDEAGAVVDRIDRHRPGRDADHGRARRDVLGDDRVGADLGALADLDRAEHLRARADDDAGFQIVGWRLPPTPVDGLVPPRVTFW